MASYIDQQTASYPSSFHSQQSHQQQLADVSQQLEDVSQLERQLTPVPLRSPPPLFRALPLLSSDLPQTKIIVSPSFVLSTNRGKEVLSFTVFVNPGNGKDGWKVEKRYSDLLELDQIVRNRVGKGVGKKVADIPEQKLWKDNAPTRVDQRTAALENYLKSLIHLPVKNKDDVIAFFASDFVRDKKLPAVQAGHKEGYLIKRGKNFGGWKTRFFVLQGPVLEYYDRRGGAHLGSITVTGSQIGRQQRKENSPSTDDEKEYRHALLVVEAKRGPDGKHPRHVLCAESDEERDGWVELLVRYFSGTYNEDPMFKSRTSNQTSVQTSSVATSQSGTGSSQTTSSPDNLSDLSSTARDSDSDESSTDGSSTAISVSPSDYSDPSLQSVQDPDDYRPDTWYTLDGQSIYSVASSRTAETDYGLFYTRMALSQTSFDTMSTVSRRSFDSTSTEMGPGVKKSQHWKEDIEMQYQS